MLSRMRANAAVVPALPTRDMKREARSPKSGTVSAVATAAPSSRTVSAPPPALPSMRVPKGTVPRELEEHDLEWELRVAETKARLAAEEREWQAQVERAKRAIAAAEEEEWRALQLRVAEAARAAEEREWQAAIARARRGATPAAAPLAPFAGSPVRNRVGPRQSRPQKNVVYWP